MDFGLYLRVLWRFRLLVAAGVAFGIALSVLSVARLQLDGAAPALTYRDDVVWSSRATLLLTDTSFPYGRAVAGYRTVPGGDAVVQVGDTSRLTNLPKVYAEIANSDRVQQLIARRVRVSGTVFASAVSIRNISGYAVDLPLVTLTSQSDTPAHARTLAAAGARSLIEFIKAEQVAAQVPPAERVIMQVLQHPRGAVAGGGPKKTVPLVVFMTVMLAVVGLAFVLENLRPKVRLAVTPTPEAVRAEPRRLA